ncbi:DNA polymerase III subunit delta [Fundidesulfovibrio terrae]|uniref:DNA polymerase III subunit delta n=1 Tax=Fundidesulfovibrio terrae TaxID=2922866 RepID=UPI001FAE8A8B|nr:DNA polymerase III subunit delta [Fundidesulfovibrio terrae]
MSDRPGFTFLVCPDPEMVKRRFERLMAASGGGFVRQVFWGDADDFDAAYWQALSSVSLFAEPKAVVLRRAEGLGADFWEKLARPLAGFNQHVWPVICLEGPQDPKKGPSLPKGLTDRPYWKVGQKKDWVWISPGLTEETMIPTLRDWAGAHRLNFGKGVLQELARVLPRDMTACARELEKMELAAVDGVIGLEQLSLVSVEAELDIFGFMKALEEGRDPAGVWRTVFGHQLASDDGFLFQFLAILSREARTMWQLLHEDPDCKVHPYVKKLKTPMAGRLGRAGLAKLWDLIMEAESSVKFGRKSADQALEMLVADLHALFARVRSRV